MLDKGVYLFSEAKKPVLDTMQKTASLEKIPPVGGLELPPGPNMNNKPKTESFIPSLHVYTYKDGYVRVSLPTDKDKKYSIKFFEEDDNFLFELKNIKERAFKLDKDSSSITGITYYGIFSSSSHNDRRKQPGN